MVRSSGELVKEACLTLVEALGVEGVRELEMLIIDMVAELVQERPEKVRKATTRFCFTVRIQSVITAEARPSPPS